MVRRASRVTTYYNAAMRHFLRPALILLLCVIPAVAAEQRPNVLLIIADDLRPELGCYGVNSIKTPNIDRLAARGRQFDFAYCQYPVCNPSRASFLTGLRPDQTQVLDNSTAFRGRLPNVITLPQQFKRNGYFTAGLGKVFHRGNSLMDVRKDLDDARSYDQLRYFSPTRTGLLGEQRNLTGGVVDWCYWQTAAGTDEDQPDGQIAATAVALMEKHRDGPFFIAAGFHKPHDPFVAPKPYFDMYPLDSMAFMPIDTLDATPLLPAAVVGVWKDSFAKFKERDKREFKRAYYAGTSFTDAQIGKLLVALDRLDLAKNTIVVFLGDHGYHLGERGWWNKNTLFEFSCRAPLIIATPGMKRPGRSTRAMVEFVDLYPTLMELCQMSPPHQLAGKSLTPFLSDPFAEWDKPALTQVQRTGFAGRAVRTEKWRYIEWDDGREGVELYDMEKDYGNYYNRADKPESRAVIEQLKPLLRRAPAGL
jgi:iduronate 2-sulfatase